LLGSAPDEAGASPGEAVPAQARAAVDQIGANAYDLREVEGLLERHLLVRTTPKGVIQRPPLLRTAIVSPDGEATWLDEEALVAALREEKVWCRTVSERQALAARTAAALEVYDSPQVISSAAEIPGYSPVGRSWEQSLPASEVAAGAGRTTTTVSTWSAIGGRVTRHRLTFEGQELVEIDRTEVASGVGRVLSRQ
jgi:hypothetical protein